MNQIKIDTSLLSLLPPWYREVLDYQEICKTEEEQFKGLASAITSVADNFFFQTMGENAVALWEQVFSIIPDIENETLSFRRARLLNRISTRPPFSLGFLYQKLDELIGPGEYIVTVDYQNYTLYVASSAQNQQYASEVAYTINQIKPAHIVYVNSPYLQSSLLLSETIELSKVVYNYRLGAWGLGISSFASKESQGVIKTAATPSITNAMLADTASFLSSDIVKARINSTEIVTSLEKSVSDSTLTIKYSAPAVGAITLLELLDSDGNVLTSSTVYIPVSSATVIEHNIPVMEGVN